MSMRYLRSKISRNTLLYSIVDGYEKQEVSGKYYLKIIEMWTDESIETSRIFDDLNSEMELSDFLKSTVEKEIWVGVCLKTTVKRTIAAGAVNISC